MSTLRATKVLPSAKWDHARAADRIALTHEDRHRRRIVMNGEDGTSFLLDMPDAVHLHDGDGLMLDDGRIVCVVAAAEPVIEITGSAHLLARVAWHIGNRHVPAQILPDRIRIGPDHVLQEMIAKLGARVSRTTVAFDPEPGAYAGQGHGHGGGHSHDHGHPHPPGHRDEH
jgi:urease accessory protein